MIYTVSNKNLFVRVYYFAYYYFNRKKNLFFIRTIILNSVKVVDR